MSNTTSRVIVFVTLTISHFVNIQVFTDACSVQLELELLRQVLDFLRANLYHRLSPSVLQRQHVQLIDRSSPLCSIENRQSCEIQQGGAPGPTPLGSGRPLLQPAVTAWVIAWFLREAAPLTSISPQPQSCLYPPSRKPPRTRWRCGNTWGEQSTETFPSRACRAYDRVMASNSSCPAVSHTMNVMFCATLSMYFSFSRKSTPIVFL
mmetsp:Transcript_5526/g.19427  ORF Transcript_5526/g.19427 Transcript_5526/m.19427 type:complete len:207 (+) Transcript_5526:1324-1944(+)